MGNITDPATPATQRRRLVPGRSHAVIEAMKMEMRLSAAAAGTVAAIHAKAGTQVENAAVLIELELSESA